MYIILDYTCTHAKSLQSCPTLCDPMDCLPPDSSIHGDSLGKNTGVGCLTLLQGIFPTQGLNPHLLCLLPWQASSLPLTHLGSSQLLEQTETICEMWALPHPPNSAQTNILAGAKSGTRNEGHQNEESLTQSQWVRGLRESVRSMISRDSFQLLVTEALPGKYLANKFSFISCQNHKTHASVKYTFWLWIWIHICERSYGGVRYQAKTVVTAEREIHWPSASLSQEAVLGRGKMANGFQFQNQLRLPMCGCQEHRTK